MHVILDDLHLLVLFVLSLHTLHDVQQVLVHLDRVVLQAFVGLSVRSISNYLSAILLVDVIWDLQINVVVAFSLLP